MIVRGRDRRLVADQNWEGRWLSADEVIERAAPGLDVVRVQGTIVPGLRDHHVHLGLVDAGGLARSALGAVDELGWIPADALTWRANSPGGCRVRVAGPFLTAPGGYPSGRPWAPDEAVVGITSPSAAATTVAGLADAGVDLIKVVLHTGMPLLDDTALAAIVAAAHARRLPVVVHAEGDGQAIRAAGAGADALAHAPWTETLADDVLAAMAGTLAWISTLAIHDESARAVAQDNLARFVRAGGRIRYGTDMGNGPTPPDLNVAELEALVAAGLDQTTILDALCRADPDPDVVTWSPEPPPPGADELPAWCATLGRRRIEDLGGRT